MLEVRDAAFSNLVARSRMAVEKPVQRKSTKATINNSVLTARMLFGIRLQLSVLALQSRKTAAAVDRAARQLLTSSSSVVLSKLVVVLSMRKGCFSGF